MDEGTLHAQALMSYNPFLIRRLEWLDNQGRRCSGICATEDVDKELEKLRSLGITDIKISKIQWVEA